MSSGTPLFFCPLLSYSTGHDLERPQPCPVVENLRGEHQLIRASPLGERLQPFHDGLFSTHHRRAQGLLQNGSLQYAQPFGEPFLGRGELAWATQPKIDERLLQ